MFLLASNEEQTVTFGDGTIRYREATAKAYREACDDPRFRDPATRVLDDFAVDREILRTHILGWDITDTAGIPMLFSPDNLTFILDHASIAAWAKLKDAVLYSVREATASGKDSENDSNG